MVPHLVRFGKATSAPTGTIRTCGLNCDVPLHHRHRPGKADRRRRGTPASRSIVITASATGRPVASTHLDGHGRRRARAARRRARRRRTASAIFMPPLCGTMRQSSGKSRSRLGCSFNRPLILVAPCGGMPRELPSRPSVALSRSPSGRRRAGQRAGRSARRRQAAADQRRHQHRGRGGRRADAVGDDRRQRHARRHRRAGAAPPSPSCATMTFASFCGRDRRRSTGSS